MREAISLNNVSYSTRSFEILKNISFEIPKNSGFAILGPNGAGKTTSVRVVGGLIFPEKGSATVNEKPITPSNAHIIRKKIGFQLDGSLYERLTAEENLKFWGNLYGNSGKVLDYRVSELLELFNLAHRRKSRVSEFSKGMKQQLALCRAIIAEPEILILDEPTSGLSPEVAKNVISYISDFRKRKDITVLLCTHELFGLEDLIDRVCIIDAGTTLASGSVSSLAKQYWPQSKYRLVVDKDVRGENVWKTAFWLQKKPEFDLNDRYTEVTFAASSEDLYLSLTPLWEAGLAVTKIEPISHSLRDIYFQTLKINGVTN